MNQSFSNRIPSIILCTYYTYRQKLNTKKNTFHNLSRAKFTYREDQKAIFNIAQEAIVRLRRRQLNQLITLWQEPESLAPVKGIGQRLSRSAQLADSPRNWVTFKSTKVQQKRTKLLQKRLHLTRRDKTKKIRKIRHSDSVTSQPNLAHQCSVINQAVKRDTPCRRRWWD